MRGWRRAAVLCLGLLALGWHPAAPAHPLPGSLVLLDFERDAIRARIELPLDQLELAYRKPLAADAAAAIAREHDALAAYLAAHVRPVAPDGRGWLVRTESLSLQRSANGPELVAAMLWMPPAGAPVRRLHLDYDAVSHELVAHQVMIAARNDWQRGLFAGVPEPLATLHWGHRALDIDRPEAPWWAPWAGLLRMGAQHIADGADHLLFLLLLLVVSPVIASGRRWTMARPAGAALRQLATVVTAFTVGHSATLALGSTGLVTPPSQLVEVAVAMSIAIAALHAMRPLFAGGEVAMALLFGLVHGFAFSASLSDAGLSAGQHALALLAFNLGIEAMQLALVVAVMPPLLMLCRLSVRGYATLRRVVAGAGFVLALLWIVERSGLVPIDTTPWFEAATRTMPFAIAAEWLVVGAVLGMRRMLTRARAGRSLA